MNKIQAYQNKQPACPTSPVSTIIPDTILDRTPHTAKEVIDQGRVIQRRVLAAKKVNSKYLARFIKDAIATAHFREIVEDELKSVERNALEKAAREKLPASVAKKGRVITAGDVRVSF